MSVEVDKSIVRKGFHTSDRFGETAYKVPFSKMCDGVVDDTNNIDADES